MNIEDVEGIGLEYATSLRGAGVTTTEALLERGATEAGRADLVATTGISAKLILEWVNHVDLMRINGVGSEYSDLLEAAGVDSPAELAQRNAANLAQTFQELDAARPNWIRSVPSVTTVEGWIAQAKTLPRIVTHGGGGGGGTTSGDAAATVASEPMAKPAMAERETAAEPVASAAAAEPPPARPSGAPQVSMSSPSRAASDEGIWARIKRLFGG